MLANIIFNQNFLFCSDNYVPGNWISIPGIFYPLLSKSRQHVSSVCRFSCQPPSTLSNLTRFSRRQRPWCLVECPLLSAHSGAWEATPLCLTGSRGRTAGTWMATAHGSLWIFLENLRPTVCVYCPPSSLGKKFNFDWTKATKQWGYRENRAFQKANGPGRIPHQGQLIPPASHIHLIFKILISSLVRETSLTSSCFFLWWLF